MSIPDNLRRTLEELAAACDPDASRPLTDDTPVSRLRRQVPAEHHAGLTEALDYIEARGKVVGAGVAYRHVLRLLAADDGDHIAPVRDLAARRAHHDEPPAE